MTEHQPSSYINAWQSRHHPECLTARPDVAATLDDPIPLYAAPEGCTPADAKMLRAANHGLADENSELTETLRDLLGQVTKFCEEQGEADFYTGRATALLRRLDRCGESADSALLRMSEIDRGLGEEP